MVSLFVLPQHSFATNGFLPTGCGAKSKGMVGAGVALALDGCHGNRNPANLVELGSRVDRKLRAYPNQIQ